MWKEHPSVAESRMAHAAAVQLQHCLNAFTSEEQLEQRYSCASCRTSQPATKKLQIWRLPPILVCFFYINFSLFDYNNNIIFIFINNKIKISDYSFEAVPIC